jgi:Skp family chaperone for outer membrane proteins
MVRDIKRVRDRVPVLPTMAAWPTAPEAPRNAELARSACRRATPGRGRNATASPPDNPGPVQASAADRPATAALPKSDKPATPARDKPSTAARPTAPLEAPADTRGAWRWLKIAAIAASVIAVAASGWLYRGEANVEMTIPPATQAGDDLAEVRQALQQERDNAEKLARELAAMWRTLRSQAEALADNAAQNQELTDLRRALQESERQSEAYQELLAQERDRNRALDEQLAARRDATQGRGRNATASRSDTPYPARATAIDKPAPALLRTSDKPVPPTVDKAATGVARTTALEAPGNPELAWSTVGDATPVRGREVMASLSDTSGPTQATATDKPAAAPLAASDKPVMPAGDKPATMSARPTEPSGNLELARLMVRASLLLSQGNIGAARTVLERAAETGSAPALFALAETYDPVVLSVWGTVGTQGDVVKAEELYAKALAGGVLEAKDRLDALR